METILSKQNAKFAYVLKLKQKKFRQSEQKILLEGSKIIDEALKSGQKLEQIFVDEKHFDDAKKFNVPTFVLSDSLCKMLSSTVTSQNMFGVMKLSLINHSIQDRVLVLDGLQNPDNLGAIIRCAVATNFLTVFAINSVDIFNEKVIRSSMGNVFKINFIKTDYQSIKNHLKNYEILVADMDGNNVFEQKIFSKKIALVIGNEGNGISEQMLNISTQKISIPMQNNVESLNASVSAGIIMYQLTKGD